MSPWTPIAEALSRPALQHETEGRTCAAVAAVLDRDWNLLFMARAQRPGDPWSGQLSFPGGRRDPEDDHLLDTAIRETREEVGLVLDPAQCIGPLDDLVTVRPIPDMLVRPFVFTVDEFGPLDLDPREVAGVHLHSLRHLLANKDRDVFARQWEGRRIELPRVQVGEAVLWGLTLQLVDDLLNRMDGGGTGVRRTRSSLSG